MSYVLKGYKWEWPKNPTYGDLCVVLGVYKTQELAEEAYEKFAENSKSNIEMEIHYHKDNTFSHVAYKHFLTLWNGVSPRLKIFKTNV